MSLLRSTLLVALLCSVFGDSLRGDVVVVANRTRATVKLEVAEENALNSWTLPIASGDSTPIFVDRPLVVRFDSGRGVESYTLDLNCVYFVGSREDKSIDLRKIGLNETPLTNLGRTLPGNAATTPVAVIPVKLLVDEEETSRQAIWEARLRQRLEKASDILHRHAMVRFEVVAVDVWQSDNATSMFEVSLGEFEKEVDPTPGKLAIGFSSQYDLVKGRVHLAGTRGALQSHILLREWSNHVSENERLELLVHELGHYLGAAHSPEPDSVMRPVLGDRKARRADFEIRFDAVNTLIMSLTAEEIRRRRVTSLAAMTTGTRTRTNQLYAALGATQPGDTSSRLLAGRTGTTRSDPEIDATRVVLHHLTEAARANSKSPAPLAGDSLFDHYVRVAANAASKVDEAHRHKAFLTALGVSIGATDQVRKLPALRTLLNRIETPADSSVRNTLVGKPTIRGRNDLAMHFAVAAMIAAHSGTEAAEAAMLAKEVLDAQGGSGFSFCDLAADKAGVLLAERIASGKRSLDQLAMGFRSADYVPVVDEFPEGLSTRQFMDQFGGMQDDRYQAMILRIDMAIYNLPGFREPEAKQPK